VQEACALSSYSLRRWNPTVGAALHLPALDRLAIGDWQDAALEGSARHLGRSAASCMPARYDGDRSTTALIAKGMCTTAVGEALREFRKGSRDMPSLCELRPHLPPVSVLHAAVSRRVGSGGASVVAAAKTTTPDPPPTKLMRLSESRASPDCGPASCSSASSSSASSSSSCGSTPADPDGVAWLLARGPRGRLHAWDGTEDDAGNPRGACSRRGLCWGAETGLGLELAAASGRPWCRACLRKLSPALRRAALGLVDAL